MIRSCRDKEAQRLLELEFSRRLQAAESLRDLDVPGFRLEAFQGDRKGQYSIRVNDRYRISFRWRGGDGNEMAIQKSKRLQPLHPGEVLKELLTEMGRRGITGDTSLR